MRNIILVDLSTCKSLLKISTYSFFSSNRKFSVKFEKQYLTCQCARLTKRAAHLANCANLTPTIT